MATVKPSILVPYDATELSIKALDKAVEIASNMDYKILLLYIIDDASFCPSKMQKFISNQNDFEKAKKYFVNSIKEGADKHLAELVNKIKEKNKTKEKESFVRYIIRVGHPADEILSVSKNSNIHLIVMGSSGSLKKRHNRRGVGSISRWISEIASCPVVLMR
jgi:nucleotide-binding universal stress UspA family protein